MMSRSKTIVLVFVIPLLSFCSSKPKATPLLIDAQKVCREPMSLVVKIMRPKASEFLKQRPVDPSFGKEHIWDLKTAVAQELGLEWMQLRFQNGRLQAIWFGPRRGLAQDLQVVGLQPRLLRDQKNRPIKQFSKGVYFTSDVNGRRFRVEHAGGPQKGTTVTCFKPRRY